MYAQTHTHMYAHTHTHTNTHTHTHSVWLAVWGEGLGHGASRRVYQLCRVCVCVCACAFKGAAVWQWSWLISCVSVCVCVCVCVCASMAPSVSPAEVISRVCVSARHHSLITRSCGVASAGCHNMLTHTTHTPVHVWITLSTLLHFTPVTLLPGVTQSAVHWTALTSELWPKHILVWPWVIGGVCIFVNVCAQQPRSVFLNRISSKYKPAPRTTSKSVKDSSVMWYVCIYMCVCVCVCVYCMYVSILQLTVSLSHKPAPRTTSKSVKDSSVMWYVCIYMCVCVCVCVYCMYVSILQLTVSTEYRGMRC